MAGIYPREAVRVKVKVCGVCIAQNNQTTKTHFFQFLCFLPLIVAYNKTQTHRKTRQAEIRNGANSLWIHK